MLGGEQENGRRGGTEDLPGVAAMVSSLEACDDLRNGSAEVQAELRHCLRVRNFRSDSRHSDRWSRIKAVVEYRFPDHAP